MYGTQKLQVGLLVRVQKFTMHEVTQFRIITGRYIGMYRDGHFRIITGRYSRIILNLFFESKISNSKPNPKSMEWLPVSVLF